MAAPMLYFNIRGRENMFWDACSLSSAAQHGTASSITPEQRNSIFAASQWHKLMEGVLGPSTIGFMLGTFPSPWSSNV